MWEPPRPPSLAAREFFHSMAVNIGSDNDYSIDMWLRPLLNARDDMKGTMLATQCAPGCKGWCFAYGTKTPLRAYLLEMEYIEVLYPHDVMGNASPGEWQEGWSSWNLHNFITMLWNL